MSKNTQGPEVPSGGGSRRARRRHRTGGVEHLEIVVFVGEHVSLATIKINGAVGIGEAKRLPGDVWSDQTGRDLAVGRALREISDQLLEKYQCADCGDAGGSPPTVDPQSMDALESGGDIE